MGEPPPAATEPAVPEMPRRPRRPAASRLAAALLAAALPLAGCGPGEPVGPEPSGAENASAAPDAGAANVSALDAIGGGNATAAAAPAAPAEPTTVGVWRAVLARQGQAVNLGSVTVSEADGGVAVTAFEPAGLAQVGAKLTDSAATRETVSFTLTPEDARQSPVTFEGRAVAGPDGPLVAGVLLDGQTALPVRLLPLPPGEPNPGPVQMTDPSYAATMRRISAGDPFANVITVATVPYQPTVFEALPALLDRAVRTNRPAEEVRGLAETFADYAADFGPELEREARGGVAGLLLQSGGYAELAAEMADAALAGLPAEEAAARRERLDQLRVRGEEAAAQRALTDRLSAGVERAKTDPAAGLADLRALAEENPDRSALTDGLALALLRYGENHGVAELRELHARRPALAATTFMLAEAEREEGDKAAAARLLAEVVAAPGGRQQVANITAGFTGDEAFVPPRVRLEALFEGADEQFEELLDDAYARAATAFAGEPRDADDSDRAVLLELFTGAQCGPCIPADLATSALTETFPAEDLILLQWHVHIPGPDPLTNADSLARLGQVQISGTPTVFIDGVQAETPAGGPPTAGPYKYEAFAAEIEEERGDPAGATVSVEATGDGDVLTYSAEADRDGGFTPNHRLHVAVAERSVKYAAENGIRLHEMLVRALPTGAEGHAPADGALRFEGELSVTDLRDSLAEYLATYAEENGVEWPAEPLDLDDLTVVAWVTDGPAGPVLQAARRDVDGLAPPEEPATDQADSTDEAATANGPAGDPEPAAAAGGGSE